MGLQIHPHRQPAAPRPDASAPRQTKYYVNNRDSNLEGFIHHPPGFPIAWRQLKAKTAKNFAVENAAQGHIGLCFESEKYIKPGTVLELAITLRGEVQKFAGRVILVRNKGDGCEIGVWFDSRPDAGRLRIVEQICHIESYLRLKRHHDGPFVSPERIAQEWISRFASTFPSFG